MNNNENQKKSDEIESINLMDLDITELERRLELAPDQCPANASASIKCCGKHA